jgi:DNA-binding response OmpR family regulator
METQTQSINVLVADDDKDSLELVKTVLDLAGWKGTYVTSATQIVDAMNTNCVSNCQCPYDAIISDISFDNDTITPRITGITAAREIRKVHSSIPILFVTAYNNSVIREEIRRVGAELLQKPFDIDMLVPIVRAIVNRQDNKEELIASAAVGTGFEQSRPLIEPSPIITSIVKDLRSRQ